jgi:hypothetical protein
VFDNDEVPVRERRRSLPGDCSGLRMAGGVVPTVIRGDGSRLCHGDDVSAYRDRRGSMGGPGVSSRCCGLARAIDEE